MPDGRPEVRVLPRDAFPDEAASVVAEALRRSLGEEHRCRLGLAGGSTPVPVYERLRSAEGIDWSRVDFFWSDERLVAPEDPDSNYRRTSEVLLDAVSAGRRFRVEGELEPERAVTAYASRLGERPLDVLLLGMGDDGHTASLFPGTEELETNDRVVATTSPVAPTARISLSLRAINEARSIVFLVSGPEKAERVAAVMAEIASGERRLPAARVQPNRGDLVWLLDSDAAAFLQPASIAKESR